MNKLSATTRRGFLRLAASSVAFVGLRPLEALRQQASPEPTIERITLMRVPGAFYRSIAMNAYDDAPKGKTGTIRLVRLFLTDGTMGVGVEGYVRIDDETIAGLQEMIGVNPLDVYRWEEDHIRGLAPAYRSFIQDPRYAWFETPLLDVVGKLKGKPVHALFGPSVRRGVDAYDGTLYFKDIELGVEAKVIGELAARIKADGYKAIKMKVGRPFKWLKGEAGVERDIAAVRAAREAVGANFNLMTDANNGYQGHFDWAMHFLEATAPYELYWMEEIFPESLDRYSRLRKAMYEQDFSVFIAEGESVHRVETFRPYLEAGHYDVIQPDMRTVGFSNVLRAADIAATYGEMLVAHNWQSELGKLMSIHAAKVKENIRFAEDDRFNNFALDASRYVFRDGQWFPPEAPGWGVELNEHYDRFARASDEQVIAGQ